ncbi:MAG: alpha-L-fucosidase [Rikenellaceae bacterium]
MKKNVYLSLLSIALMGAAASCSTSTYYPDTTHTSSPKGTDLFKPDSLSIGENYTIPEWFTNDKLGIFIHWGVYSVPAYGSEWYARCMYQEGHKINKYHQETYGSLTEFGYKDFIPMFKAESFDAASWAKLFKESGARYVVPVAEHHDGFAMYNSAFNPWNSVDMGPKRDVIGELSKAIKAEGLVFGLSSHRAENPWFYNEGMKIPSDVRDGNVSLYGQCLERPGGKGMTPEYGDHPGSNEESREQWLLHMYELIDQYQPELIWFDWTVGKYPFQPTFYKFMAYYYNNALDWGKEVVVNTKCGYSDQSQVFDIERGKSDRIRRYAWQTDTSIGKKSWSYTPDEVNKTPNHIIDDFVDIVSKNGNLLLNIGPKVDGTITDEQQHVLRELGAWLKVNGEAIYDTRAWVRWGEGDNAGTSGYMTDGDASHYTAHDIRFTENGDALYATTLDWTDGDIVISSLAPACGDNLKVTAVSMLGSAESVEWEQTAEGLRISFPEKKPSDYAHSFKIEYEGVAYGDIQGDIVDDTVTVEQYIRNNNDQEISIDVVCSNNGEEQSRAVVVPAHQKIVTEFKFTTDQDDNNISLSINGEQVATKRLSLAKQRDVQGKTKSVIHTTNQMPTKKTK